jgi:omega-hydroxy-beta-dihydromenaquinone-9 sulfotransferase
MDSARGLHIHTRVSRSTGSIDGVRADPRNVYYLAELLELLPDAVAVHITRDPRDVLLSQKHRWRRRRLGSRVPLRNSVRTWAGYHPVTTSLLWRSGVRAGQRLDRHPRVAQVRFEDVLADPPDVVGRLCQRLGLDFEPSMLDIPWVGSSLRADAPERRGVDPTATGRWQAGLTATEVLLCQRITGLDALRLGYAPEPVRLRPAGLLGAGVTLALKSGLVIALNVRRARRVGPALRRRLRS